MSRTLSPAAIKAMYSPDSDDTLVTLITLVAKPTSGLLDNIYLADNYTDRITSSTGTTPSTTDSEVIYGITSNSIQYHFLPLEIVLPNDSAANAPQMSLTIHDATRYLTPYIRQLTGSIPITIQVVLKSTPNIVEITYSGFTMSSITYNSSTITAQLIIPSIEVEPFPAHSFTPAYFPGLF